MLSRIYSRLARDIGSFAAGSQHPEDLILGSLADFNLGSPAIEMITKTLHKYRRTTSISSDFTYRNCLVTFR